MPKTTSSLFPLGPSAQADGSVSGSGGNDKGEGLGEENSAAHIDCLPENVMAQVFQRLSTVDRIRAEQVSR